MFAVGFHPRLIANLDQVVKLVKKLFAGAMNLKRTNHHRHR
jgi:hypothetical protein